MSNNLLIVKCIQKMYQKPIFEKIYNIISKLEELDIDILKTIFNNKLNKQKNIIVYGEFGSLIKNLYSDTYNIINIHDINNLDLEYIKHKIYNNKWCLLDLYYNDIITKKIQDEIRKNGGFIYNTFVLYNGGLKMSHIIHLYDIFCSKNFKYQCQECNCRFNEPHILKTDFINEYLCPECFCTIEEE